MALASSSGHWYALDGTPMYEVPTKDGKKMKKVTLREARELNLVPGITSIIKVMAAPGLVRWQREQAAMAALTLPRNTGESDKEFVTRILEDAEAQVEAAADEGTRIHAAIERAIAGEAFDPAYAAHVAGVRAVLLSVCGGDQVWNAEKSYASVLGYGTKIDLHSDEWLWDFKGKDGDLDSLREEKLWDNHKMQLAAGRFLIRSKGLPSPKHCGIVFVSRTHPGAAHALAATEDELAHGWEMFSAALELWQAKNQYAPRLP